MKLILAIFVTIIVNKMYYSEAIKYLYEQLPMYQRSGAIAYKDNLANSFALDKLFKNPHRNYKTIHVAGTNGKGSVSHMLASVLQKAGYKVGLYTSPHLKDYRERIRVNGKMITEDAVCDFLDRFKAMNVNALIEPSFFELSVTMAFDYFSKCEIDVAVVEVGLGGRLDSTNVILPELSIITNISFDHTNLLGNTLGAIAGEKAGIIKSNIPIVIGETQAEIAPVFTDRAKLLNSPLFFADHEFQLSKSSNDKFDVISKGSIYYSDLEPDLKGEYQSRNIVTTIAALEQLKGKGFDIKKEDVSSGLKNTSVNTGLMGRWQQIGNLPKIICDTAHNEAGITWIVKQLKTQKYNNLHIVFGMVSDKDIVNILVLLPTNATYYFTRANIDRAYDENKLMVEADKFNLKGKAYNKVNEALAAAKQNANIEDLIFVGGSTFIVAEVI